MNTNGKVKSVLDQKNEYKNTVFGFIPKDWEIVKLKDISIRKGTYGIGAAAVEYNENLPRYLRITDIDDQGRIINEDPKCVDDPDSVNYILKKNDLVFARTGNTTGKTYLYKNEDGVLVYAGFLIKFSINPIKADSRFVKYFTETNYYWQWVGIMSMRSGQPGINENEYSKLTLPLPPLPEQQKIASILSTWDKAIELKEKLIEQKKKQKKGLMQKLLTGEVRLPGFDGEWKKVKLAKVVRKTKGKAVEYIEGGKFPAIDMDYLESGTFKNYSNDATVFAEKNDVLLLWDGSRAGMAFTGVEGAVGSTFVKLECKSIHNIFLQKHFEMNEQRIQRLREGSGIPHVPKDFLDYYKVKMPSMEEQKAIAYVLNNMDRDLELLWKEVAYLKEQKQGLMQLLLTGKVRVQV